MVLFAAACGSTTPGGTSAGGAMIYVANFGAGTVTPINLATWTPRTPIKVGKEPGAIAIIP